MGRGGAYISSPGVGREWSPWGGHVGSVLVVLLPTEEWWLGLSFSFWFLQKAEKRRDVPHVLNVSRGRLRAGSGVELSPWDSDDKKVPFQFSGGRFKLLGGDPEVMPDLFEAYPGEVLGSAIVEEETGQGLRRDADGGVPDHLAGHPDPPGLRGLESVAIFRYAQPAGTSNMLVLLPLP